MSHRKHHTVFNELLNRYDTLFISVVGKHFKNKEEAQDVYQDFLMHLLILVETHYEDSLDLINTASWLKAVVSNFCKSAIRQKNPKRKIKIDRAGFSALHIENYSLPEETSPFVIKNEQGQQVIDMADVIKHLLGLLSKKDALTLKMKYYYGKSSSLIGKKLNIKHVDVKISRIKASLIKRAGIEKLSDLEPFFMKNN